EILATVGPVALPLVGREHELGALWSAWRASDRDARVVLLEGEHGIGKTRLAEAFAAGVREETGIVLAGRVYPGEGAIAYGPIAGLLRAGLAVPDGPRRLAALEETARADLGLLVDLPAPVRPASGGPSIAPDAPGARVRLLEAIAGALTALTSGAMPGVVWIDDLHLADDATREAVAYLARRLTSRPLLLLVAIRREDLTAGRETMVAALARL